MNNLYFGLITMNKRKIFGTRSISKRCLTYGASTRTREKRSVSVKYAGLRVERSALETDRSLR